MHLQEQLNHTLERSAADLARVCELIDPGLNTHLLLQARPPSARESYPPSKSCGWSLDWRCFAISRSGMCCASSIFVWARMECVAPSADVQGRQRLGLRMLAVDGVVWSTPNTPENRRALGRERDSQQGAGHKRHWLMRAKELAARYCQRWEIELGFREIKQSLQGIRSVLRSKQPDWVRQELWGVLIAYTLIRRLIRLTAQKIKVESLRIGFHVAAIAIIEVLRFAPLETAGTLPRRLATLLEQASLFLLPPRRTERSFPRAVKRRVAKYPIKMPVSA